MNEYGKGAKHRMTIPCAIFTALAVLAVLGVLGPQSAAAYESSSSSQRELQKNDSQKYRARQQGQRRPQSDQANPWEVRPWEKPVEGKPWEARPWAQEKGKEESRRVGRKARKERQEKKTESVEDPGNYKERVSQRQGKLRRHQMDSERYYSGRR